MEFRQIRQTIRELKKHAESLKKYDSYIPYIEIEKTKEDLFRVCGRAADTTEPMDVDYCISG
jgi:hypothetical protein